MIWGKTTVHPGINLLPIIIVVLASSVSGFVVPSLLFAHASTNANLSVSAENSQFNNYFGGPQVIQVIVSDPDINRLDQAYGEPVVTVNGKKLRMAQATDGNWYAYFADRSQAIAAANTAVLSGKGLNFGGFCSSTSTFSPKAGVDYTETKGFTLSHGGFGSTNRTSGKITLGGLPVCTNVAGINASQVNPMEHVVRQNKTLNSNGAGFAANAVYENVWPIIQLYDFSGFPVTVTIDYQKSGGDQISTLTFDRIPSYLVTSNLERSGYPQDANVFVTLNDPQLNIDPTEEDSWTWGASSTNNTLYYEAFTRNGVPDADGTRAMQNLSGNLTTFMFDHNGKLTINSTFNSVRVIDFQANGKMRYATAQRGDPSSVRTESIGPGSEPITFIEQGGVDTGVFGDWDGSKISEIITANNPAIRGQSATITYNDIIDSIVGSFAFGTITQTSFGEWHSGQRITVTLTDNDANKNSRISEHLNLYDPTVARIPAMKIGAPFSLSSGNPVAPNEKAAIFSSSSFIMAPNGTRTITFPLGILTKESENVAQDEPYSFRPIFKFDFSSQGLGSRVNFTNTGGIVVDLNTTMSTLLNTIHDPQVNGPNKFQGFNFLNFDLRSVSNLGGSTGDNPSAIQIFLVYDTSTSGRIIGPGGTPVTTGLKAISLANSTLLQDFINLDQIQPGKVDNGVLVSQRLFSIPSSAHIGLLFSFADPGMTDLSPNGQPLVADFFSMGIIDNGTNSSQRIDNGIYRFELAETGANTGIFAGTNEYLMLNQLNLLDPNTFTSLRTIGQDINFPAIDNMLQSHAQAPQVTYLDLGADGVNTQQSAQVDIPTHTGSIVFDSKSYKIGDTATVTLNDADLNTNNDLVVIYTAVKPVGPTNTVQDSATDTIGKTGLGNYTDVTPFGRMVDVVFGPQEIRWSNSNIRGQIHNSGACFGTNDSSSLTAGGFSPSLSASGFALVETGPGSGIFTGTFEIPDQLCQHGTIVSSEGQTIKVNYVDFTDESGKTVIVTDNSGIPTTTTQDNRFTILFKSGQFTPTPGFNLTSITAGHIPSDTVHFLLQFAKLPDQSELNEIDAKGIHLINYVTGYTYIASSNASSVDNVPQLPNARWAGKFISEAKMSNALSPLHLAFIPSWASTSKSQVLLTIQFNRDTNIKEDVSNITNLGGSVKAIVPIIPSITASFDGATIQDKVHQIAELDDVQYVDYVSPPLGEALDHVRNVTGVQAVQDSSTGLDGSNVIVLEYDGGIADQNHPDFGSRVTSETGGAVTNHATGVAGIIGGDGSSRADKKYVGIAPNVKIKSYEQPTGSSGGTGSTGFGYDSGSKLVTSVQNEEFGSGLDIVTMSLADIFNATSHNYDCASLGNYSDISRDIDGLVTGTTNVRPQGLIFFEAAGNNRDITKHSEYESCHDWFTIGPPATAKDSIVVGATNTNDNTTLSFSSLGPTIDGRIKPDITAPGCHIDHSEGIMTTAETSMGTHYLPEDCGTSEASPAAAGVGALLIQEWNIIHGTEGVSFTHPPPHTVKAILIHTAIENGTGPNYGNGWGRINAFDAINLVRDNGPSDRLINIDRIPHVSEQTYPYSAVKGSEYDVKATLVWDDPEATPLSNQLLINDLDLRLEDPNHNYHCPFILNPSSPSTGATTGNDNTNNVEMIIASPPPGASNAWTAHVYGSGITQGPQNFTLIISEVPHDDKFNFIESHNVCGPVIAPSSPMWAVINANSTGGEAPLHVLLNANPVGGTGPYTYQWDFNDGSSATTGPNQLHSFNDPNKIFHVALTLTDTSGKTASSYMGIRTIPEFATSTIVMASAILAAVLLSSLFLKKNFIRM